MYRLFYINDHWYLFFRYHQILCERLHKIYKHSLNIAEHEHNDRRMREQSVAEALKLRSKTKLDVSATEYYPTFLDIVRNLLDGNIDSFQYEDTLREMFGIHAYVSFTLDKVVQNCVRQVSCSVSDKPRSLRTLEMTVLGFSRKEGKKSSTTIAEALKGDLFRSV
jgi:paired amphipathic helix protein Sin3a